MRPILFAATALAIVAAPALARQAPMVKVADQTMVSNFNLNADVVEELDVYSSAGVKIGDVEEVVGPDRNTAQGIVVDFADSAPAYGRQDRIIPIKHFTFAKSRLILKASAKAVSSMPVWAD